MPRSLACTLAAALLAALAATGHADIEGDVFESGAWRVRMTAPKTWQLTEQTAYPNIILRMSRRDPDGKMLLSAERLAPGLTTLTYAQRTGDLLRSMGFKVRSPQLHASTGAYFVDFEQRGAFLRQAFLVAGGIGYSLTLAAPDHRTRSQHLRAFDYALRSIHMVRPGEVAPSVATDRSPIFTDQEPDRASSGRSATRRPADLSPETLR